MTSPYVLSLVAILLVIQTAPARSTLDVVALRQEIDTLVKAQNWPAAIEKLRQLVVLGEARSDLELQADGWQRLGLGQQQLKDVGAARSSFERALQLQITRGDRAGIGSVRNSLGILAWQQNDTKGMREHFAAAAEDYGIAGRVEQQVNALRNLTFVPDMPVSEKLTILEGAWKLAEPLDDARVKGLVLQNLGDYLVVSGNYRRGVERLEAAAVLLEKQDPSTYSVALTSLGRALRMHGLYDESIEMYQRTLAIQQPLGDLRRLAQTWDAIGVAHSYARRYGDAVAAAQRAMEFAERAANVALLQGVKMNAALALAENGEMARGITLLEGIVSEGIAATIEPYARNLLARFYRRSGRLDDAQREAEQSLVTADRTGSVDARVVALSERSRLRWLQRNGPGALADATAALELIEGLRGNAVALDSMKRSFSDPHAELFGLAIEVQQASGDAAGALETAERARARALLDLLASRDLDAPPPAAKRGAEPVLSSIAVQTPPSFQSIRAAVTERRTTLISYWVAPDATTIWVVRPNGDVASRRVVVPDDRFAALGRQLAYGVPGRARGDDAGDAAAEIPLTARSGSRVTLARDPAPPLRQLYELLIAPIATLLPKDDGALLTIVPHGPLFAVPFAALVDARGRYLVETYRVHLVPTAALLNRPRAAARAPTSGIVIVADPQPMAPSDDGALGALPGAREEGRAIARLFPAGRATTLIGTEATEAGVRKFVSGRRAVHFATHALVFADRPFESFLALAGGRDARLDAGEIYRLRLDADLVVLSACRTATGTITGDGVIGLARAFMYAGTPSIVASLWDLPDTAPLQLMPAFYKRWLRDGDAAAALREAQLAYLRALRAGTITVTTPLGSVKLPEHPMLWAGMVLIGQPN